MLKNYHVCLTALFTDEREDFVVVAVNLAHASDIAQNLINCLSGSWVIDCISDIQAEVPDHE